MKHRTVPIMAPNPMYLKQELLQHLETKERRRLSRLSRQLEIEEHDNYSDQIINGER